MDALEQVHIGCPWSAIYDLNNNGIYIAIDDNFGDSSGRLVSSLLNESLSAGNHCIEWNGKNETGTSLNPGIFYCVLKTGNRKILGQMVLIE